MKDFTEWKSVHPRPSEVSSVSETDPDVRRIAKEEAINDLRKPIQQLIRDVHEEALNRGRSVQENQIHVMKRMVSMMGRVALAHERSSSVLVRLTWVLVVLTVAIVGLTMVLVLKGG